MMRAGQRHPRRARDRDNLRRQAACEDGTRFQGGGLATLGVEPVGDRVATSPSKVLRTSRMYFAASRVGNSLPRGSRSFTVRATPQGWLSEPPDPLDAIIV
jgi:hypothetical protein